MVVTIVLMGCGGDDIDCESEEGLRLNFRACQGEEAWFARLAELVPQLDTMTRDPEPGERLDCETEDVRHYCSEGGEECAWVVDTYRQAPGAEPMLYCSCAEALSLEEHKRNRCG